MTHGFHFLIAALFFLTLGIQAADRFPLHEAVESDDRKKVEALLSQGADVNAKDKHGQTPLHTGEVWQEPDLVKLLEKHGAKRAPK